MVKIEEVVNEDDEGAKPENGDKAPTERRAKRPKRPKKAKKLSAKRRREANDDDADSAADLDEPSSSNATPEKGGKSQVYLPSMPLGEDEELVCDPKAYLLHHQVQTGYPCLCFDVIPDSSNKDNKNKTNFDCYIVAGTQAERRNANRILVMKLENLKIKDNNDKEADSDEDSDILDTSSDEEENEAQNKPQLRASAIRHDGAVNRVKFSASNSRVIPVVASWSDSGKVGIYDLSAALVSLSSNAKSGKYVGGSRHGGQNAQKKGRNNLPEDVTDAADPLLQQFDGHETEGFALDWSPTVGGQLLSGDCAGKIFLWVAREASWVIDKTRPFTDHQDSVEDLQWSPTESSVFCSCSADASVRIWDIRAANRKSQLNVENAHSSDVNVIAWNKIETSLLLSGGDDAALKVWDLRTFSNNSASGTQPVANFQHHTKPITSVGWCPHDSSVFAASGEDDQLTLWDLAVEVDDGGEEKGEEENDNGGEEGNLAVPPQLLFIHQGQKEIKELRWYPHSEGVVMSVASTGLDIFRTVSV